MGAIPFTLNYDRRMVRLVRNCRHLTLSDMEKVMGVGSATIRQIERGTLDFSINYQSKFDAAIKKLNISQIEMASLELLLTIKRENDNK